VRRVLSFLRRERSGLRLDESFLPEEFFEPSPADGELAGAPVYILAREPELRLGAELAVEVMRRTFKREALEGLRALIVFDVRSADWAFREARERCAPEAARAVELAHARYQAQLKFARKLRARELSEFGTYIEGVAVAGVHPSVSFSGWVYLLAHELLHHAFRRCPGRGENLKPLAEALLETCPSLRERFNAEELAEDEEAAHFLEEETVDFIAHRYFEKAAREPGPASPQYWLAGACFRLRFGEEAFWKRFHKLLERGEVEPVSDGPLRRAAHALLLRWIQRFPADVYAEKLAELADAYAARLRELAEEVPQRLRWLAEKPEPDALFEGLRKLERLEELLELGRRPSTINPKGRR
jgi:hypothetical protein